MASYCNKALNSSSKRARREGIKDLKVRNLYLEMEKFEDSESSPNSKGKPHSYMDPNILDEPEDGIFDRQSSDVHDHDLLDYGSDIPSPSAAARSSIDPNCVANIENLSNGELNYFQSHFSAAVQPPNGINCVINSENLIDQPGPTHFSNAFHYRGNENNGYPNYPQTQSSAVYQFPRGPYYIANCGYPNNGDPSSHFSATVQFPRDPNQNIRNLNYPPNILYGRGNFSAVSQFPRGPNYVANCVNLSNVDPNHPQSHFSTVSRSSRGSNNDANREMRNCNEQKSLVQPVELDSNMLFLLSLHSGIESMPAWEQVEFKIQALRLMRNLRFPQTQDFSQDLYSTD